MAQKFFNILFAWKYILYMILLIMEIFYYGK